MKDKVVFDLDGCVSDDRWRRKLLGDGYDEYHSRAVLDEPANFDVVEQHSGHTIVFVTGRPEKYRSETEQWIVGALRANYPYQLFMRPNGNKMSSPELKIMLLEDHAGMNLATDIKIAYDDREDVVAAYRAHGARAQVLALPESNRAGQILRSMAKTYEERNALYRDNYRMVPQVIKALFPDGVPPELIVEEHWHLFELIVVKLTRFATSGATHADSIHDIAIYSAMIEAILEDKT